VRAEIFIEDAEQGANVRFVFSNGFNAKSPAHQLAQVLQAQLDALAAGGVLTALPLEQDIVADAGTSDVVVAG